MTSTAAASFLDYCRLRTLEQTTLDTYGWALGHLEQHCPFLPDNHRVLLDTLARVRLGPDSRHNLERVLRTFYKWLAEGVWLAQRYGSSEARAPQAGTP